MLVRKRQRYTEKLLSSVLGIVGALLCFEVALRPFVAGWNYPVTPVREIRQYTEGMATSHFVPDGIAPYGHRVTGNAFLPDAPVGIVLSDSHGLAEAVPDQATASSVIERLSRNEGKPLNVEMYGWTGAAAPTYVATAGEITDKWHPVWVAVVLNYTDLTQEPIYGLGDAWYWQMKIKPDLSIELVDQRPPTPAGRMEAIRQFLGRSTLALTLRRRTVLIAGNQQPEPKAATQASDQKNSTVSALKDQIPLVPRASVRALKQAYGDRLLIIYAPECAPFGPLEQTNSEKELLNACREEGAVCSSVREAMISARDTRGQLYRGFNNTAPCAGHLNEVGQEIVAKEIWRLVAGSSKGTSH